MKRAWLVWERSDHVDPDCIADAQIVFTEPNEWQWMKVQEIVWTEVILTK